MGNEKPINVWEDNWIPSLNSSKLLTPNNMTVGVLLVRDLIDLESNCWNQTLINRIVNPIDQEAILKIPITNTNYVELHKGW